MNLPAPKANLGTGSGVLAGALSILITSLWWHDASAQAAQALTIVLTIPATWITIFMAKYESGAGQ